MAIDGPCFLLRDDNDPSSLAIIHWPEGSRKTDDRTMKVPGLGEVRVGDHLEATGGYIGPSGTDQELVLPEGCTWEMADQIVFIEG